MEEEIIKKSFCNDCENKAVNCFKLKIKQHGEIKVYRCINYKRRGDVLVENDLINRE